MHDHSHVPRPAPRVLASSALRRSAVERLGFVAVPILFLWLLVGLTLAS